MRPFTPTPLIALLPLFLAFASASLLAAPRARTPTWEPRLRGGADGDGGGAPEAEGGGHFLQREVPGETSGEALDDVRCAQPLDRALLGRHAGRGNRGAGNGVLTRDHFTLALLGLAKL